MFQVSKGLVKNGSAVPPSEPASEFHRIITSLSPYPTVFFFADYVSEQIWSLRYDGQTVTDLTNWTTHLTPDQGRIGEISSFGEDAAGNLYIVDLGGEVFKLRCDGSLAGDFDRDCDVDGRDFAHLGAGWRSTEGDVAWNPLLDVVTQAPEGIDTRDLTAFLDNWLMQIQELLPVPPGRAR
jgi:hypothetical protein